MIVENNVLGAEEVLKCAYGVIKRREMQVPVITPQHF